MAVLLAGLAVVIASVIEEPRVNVGDKAPNFTVTSLTGKTLTRGSFGGKLLVLNFWATWCPPCVAEMPSLNEFHRQLQGDGVVVVAVSVDKNEKAVHDFVQRFGLEFEIALDPTADIPASYGTYQYPETYIIDSQGRVIEKLIAEQNWADPQIIQRVKKYL